MKEKFFSWFKDLNLPSREECFFAFDSLSPKVKNLALLFLLLLIVSSLLIINEFNNRLMVDVPLSGGSLVEGVIGSPRFINPVLAVSDVDRDLATLVYSGLLRLKQDGGYQLDLAESYTRSEDGLVYTFKLKEGLLWPDNEKIKAEDIIFTIKKIQDPEVKSPRRGRWNGVEIEEVDEQTIKFTLKKPYNFFLDNLTVGILPAHLWRELPLDQFSLTKLNTRPIGSGPYEIAGTSEDANGLPLVYNLRPAKNFVLGKAKINLVFKFYNNEEDLTKDLKAGSINSVATLSPESVKNLADNSAFKILEASLPRNYSVFLNHNRNQLFVEPAIRQALALAVDKEKIVEEVLAGYGQILAGPVPSKLLKEETPPPASLTERQEEAKKLLASKNWQQDETGQLLKKATNSKASSTEAVFTLATANVPELKKTAELLAKDWEKLGFKVELRFFEPNDLNQDLIKPRRYEAVLFGEVLGRDYDLYPFWHSSQRLDPGLNIALYVNNKTDKLLEEIRESVDLKDSREKYQQLNDAINKDQPAIFLYQPNFIYLVPRGLKGIQLTNIASPNDRLSESYRWHFKTERVWKIFANL